MINALIICSRL